MTCILFIMTTDMTFILQKALKQAGVQIINNNQSTSKNRMKHRTI